MISLFRIPNMVFQTQNVKQTQGGKNVKDSSLDPAKRDANVIIDSPDCVLDAVRMDERSLCLQQHGR